MRKIIIWFFAKSENTYSPISSVNLHELSEGEEEEDFGNYIDKWVADHPLDINAAAYKQHRVVVTSYQAALEDCWTWIPDDAEWNEYGIEEEDE